MSDSLAPEPLAAPAAALNAPIGRNRQFRLLWTCMLVIGAGNSMLLSVAPPLVRQLHLGDSAVGWIFSLSALLWVVASPYWGRLSDSIGRKPTIAFGLGAYAVSMTSFGIATTLGISGMLAGAQLFVTLVLARAIGAFGSASSPSAQAYIADRTSTLERTTQLAGLSSAFAVGQAFGPGICAWIAAQTNLVFPIWLVAGLALAASLSILFLLPERTSPQTASRPRGDFKQSLTLVSDRRLSGYLICGLALSVIAGISQQIYGLYTMDRLHVAGREGTQLTSWGFMANALALLATQLIILPRLSFGPRTLIIWGAALLAMGFVVQVFAPNLSMLMAAQALQGFGGGLARSGFTGGASVAVDPHEQGAAAGLVVAINGAGFIFSPVLGGVAYEHLGMIAPLLIATAIILGMFSFALMSRRLRDSVVAHPAAEPEPG